MLTLDLAAFEGGNESSIFLTFAWNEYFHSDTPDTFKPRLSNVSSLVDELNLLTPLLRTDQRWSTHAKHIREEISEAIHRERTWNSLPWILSLVEDLEKPGDITELENTVKLLKHEIDSNQDIYFQNLEAALSEMPERKGNLLKALAPVATYARRHGYDHEDASELLDLDYSSLDPIEIFNSIKSSVLKDKESMTCLVAIRGKEADVEFLRRNTDIRKSRTNDFPLDEKGQSFKASYQAESIHVVAIDLHARFYREAARYALDECQKRVDAFNFFQNRQSCEVRTNVLVTTERWTRAFDHHPQHSLGQKPQRNTKQLVARVLTNNVWRPEIAYALEQHSLALSSNDAKSSIVNLWASLECLVGNQGEGPNLPRVTAAIAPLVALRRIEKIARYLAVNTHFLLRAIEQQPDRKIFPFSNNHQFAARDVFDAITGPNENTKIIELFRIVGFHPLLRYRIYKAWKDFHDPRSISRSLKASRQSIDWQLARIYRTRNLIVHQGHVHESANELIDNLQYYVSRCVSRIVGDLHQNPSWSVGMSLQSNINRYRYVVDALAGKTSNPIPLYYLFPSDKDFENEDWQPETPGDNSETNGSGPI